MKDAAVEPDTEAVIESNVRLSKPSKARSRAVWLARPRGCLEPRAPSALAFDHFLRDHQLGFDVRDISVFLRLFIGVES
jgi:hypothetical protein